jgi:hypothetical protein
MSVSPALQDVEDLAFRRLSAFAVRRRVAQEPIQALEVLDPASNAGGMRQNRLPDLAATAPAPGGLKQITNTVEGTGTTIGPIRS